MQQLTPNTLLQGRKYKIEKVLGQGGFGITYLASQTMLEGNVAIKEFLFKDYCSRDESTCHVTIVTESYRDLVARFKQKFIKEARTIFRLDQPNIVHIHDIFEENGTAYYVMDYIEGESLSELVKRNGCIPETEAIGYIEKVGDALSYLHNKRINHLDIKPSNILKRASDGKIFLIDFGVSKQYDIVTDKGTTTTPVGISHGYSPAEQYANGGVQEFSPQSDVYALAATLYKLLTGVTPPVAMEVQDKGLPLTPLYNESISKIVIDAIVAAMRPKSTRTQSIDEFIKALSTPVNDNFDDEDTLSKTASVSSNDDIDINILKSKAEGGDADAQHNIGMCYLKGKGVQEDYIEAIKWLRKSAEQGNADAQTNLGYMYSIGEGVQQDYTEAIRWFKLAANQGHASAQVGLGRCNQDGLGTQQNYLEAVKWYSRAAEQEDSDAQYLLGLCYLNGKGVQQNHSEAIKWFRKAIEQGNADAQCQLGKCYQNGWGVQKDATEAIIRLKTAAEQGNLDAQYQLGYCYENGNGVAQNYEEAVKWFKMATNQGSPDAQLQLGVCYYAGYGLQKNYTEAIKYFELAAEQGNSIAQYDLAACYTNGEGVEQNDVEAVKWYQKAAEQGYSDAQYNLGLCHEMGNGVSKDIKKAMKWYQSAANQGNTEAQSRFTKYRLFRKLVNIISTLFFIISIFLGITCVITAKSDTTYKVYKANLYTTSDELGYMAELTTQKNPYWITPSLNFVTPYDFETKEEAITRTKFDFGLFLFFEGVASVVCLAIFVLLVFMRKNAEVGSTIIHFMTHAPKISQILAATMFLLTGIYVALILLIYFAMGSDILLLVILCIGNVTSMQALFISFEEGRVIWVLIIFGFPSTTFFSIPYMWSLYHKKDGVNYWSYSAPYDFSNRWWY